MSITGYATNSLGMIPSPGVEENHSRGAFYACARATSSILYIVNNYEGPHSSVA